MRKKRKQLTGKKKALTPLHAKLFKKEIELLEIRWRTSSSSCLVKFHILMTEILLLKQRISAIKSIPENMFRYSGKLDKRKQRRANKKIFILQPNIGIDKEVLNVSPIPSEIQRIRDE